MTNDYKIMCPLWTIAWLLSLSAPIELKWAEVFVQVVCAWLMAWSFYQLISFNHLLSKEIRKKYDKEQAGE